jgi:hypothetical protein
MSSVTGHRLPTYLAWRVTRPIFLKFSDQKDDASLGLPIRLVDVHSIY